MLDSRATDGIGSNMAHDDDWLAVTQVPTLCGIGLNCLDVLAFLGSPRDVLAVAKTCKVDSHICGPDITE